MWHGKQQGGRWGRGVVGAVVCGGDGDSGEWWQVYMHTYIIDVLVMVVVVVWVVVVVAVVQVEGWLRSDLAAGVRGQPGQLGHTGNEQFSVRRMGSGGAASGSVQFCITAFDTPSACLLFGTMWRWWNFVPPHVNEKGWRMMPVRFME